MRKPLGRWLICPNLSSFQQKSSQWHQDWDFPDPSYAKGGQLL
jgi:hypothetical protein